MNLKDRAFLAGPESTGHRYGERLLPICIREIAEQDPERLFAEFIDPPLLLENNSDNIWRLTFREFSRMIDRAAWWLDAKFRENGLTKGTTFAYLGRADVRYLVILVAAMKCGYPVRHHTQAPSTGCCTDHSQGFVLLPPQWNRRTASSDERD